MRSQNAQIATFCVYVSELVSQRSATPASDHFQTTMRVLRRLSRVSNDCVNSGLVYSNNMATMLSLTSHVHMSSPARESPGHTTPNTMRRQTCKLHHTWGHSLVNYNYRGIVIQAHWTRCINCDQSGYRPTWTLATHLASVEALFHHVLKRVELC